LLPNRDFLTAEVVHEDIEFAVSDGLSAQLHEVSFADLTSQVKRPVCREQ
jgi:hypothetical protein